MILRISLGAIAAKVLAACSPQRVPPEAETGAIKGGGRVLAVTYLSEPNLGDYVVAVRVKLDATTEENRAVLVRKSGASELMGLYRRWDRESPIEFLHFETADARYITGLIDVSITGTLDSIEMWHNTPTPADWLNATKAARIYSDRSFLFPIYREEYSKWQLLKGARILSKEFFAASRVESDASRAQGRPYMMPPKPFERIFTPPYNLDQALKRAT